MASIVLKVEGTERVIKELRRRGISVGEALEPIFQAGAEIFAEEAANKARRASNTLADAMMQKTTKRTKTQIEVHIGPDRKKAWFAHFLEFGTKAHQIRRKSRKALRLENGKFAAKVRHPGMAARPFMRPAFDEKNGAASREIGQRFKRAVR